MSHPLEENAAKQIIDLLNFEPGVWRRDEWLFDQMKDHWDREEFVAGLAYAENKKWITLQRGRVTLKRHNKTAA